MNARGDRKGTGIVYLVGAGPGDPGLLTRRGAEVLAMADAVVYDRLADHSILSLAPIDAEMIYVGKQARVHTVSQEEINRILRDKALEGKSVVRLKGGDPFVFGRGGEEASFLRKHGVRFVVVPGVTSAVAAPACAGIPVTDRRYASSFTVVTGHEMSLTEPRLDWADIAKGAGTLVVLMGLTNLAAVARRLIREGRPAYTPAAVIERGTTTGQRVVAADLDQIAKRALSASLRSPAVLVVGEVVRLRETLAWHEAGPLAGRRILVPRVWYRPDGVTGLLNATGAEVVETPALRRQANAPVPDLRERIRMAEWLLFTSPQAVDILLEQLEGMGADVRELAGRRLATLDRDAHARLRGMHLKVDHLHSLPAKRLLIVGGTGEVEPAVAAVVALGNSDNSDDVPGFDIHTLTVSSWVADPRFPVPPLREFDAVVFTAPGTVRAFADTYKERPGRRQFVVSMGPSVSARARAKCIRIDAEVEPAEPEAIVRLIAQRFAFER